ncbi:MAG: transglutaminase domain-containing protein [Lachnospiraceae bacterium]|nr:transglutaminase domain-containing protein [Lachnospiraceae bacterium]
MKVVYDNSDKKSLLVMVEGTTTSNTQRYYYKLNDGKNSISVPLTEGNGSYKVRLCQVRSDGKAAVLESDDFSLNLTDRDSVFLRSSVIVNYAVSTKVTKKAKSLVKKCKTESDKIAKVYKYVVSNYKYDYENLKTKTSTSYYVPNITTTFEKKTGICYDISCVIAAMLRSQGIETKVVTGHTPNVKEYHAWNQIKDSSNKWFTIDATYDVCLYSKVKNPTRKTKDSEYSDIVYQY